LLASILILAFSASGGLETAPAEGPPGLTRSPSRRRGARGSRRGRRTNPTDWSRFPAPATRWKGHRPPAVPARLAVRAVDRPMDRGPTGQAQGPEQGLDARHGPETHRLGAAQEGVQNRLSIRRTQHDHSPRSIGEASPITVIHLARQKLDDGKAKSEGQDEEWEPLAWSSGAPAQTCTKTGEKRRWNVLGPQI